MLAVHSNPLAEPGEGDAGGMTVYIRQIARTLAARGVEVDIFTRRDMSRAAPETILYDGVRVIQVEAGPAGLPKEQIPLYLPEFTCNLTTFVQETASVYEMIHSHYWLSGRVAAKLSARWCVPFVHTFHTLGLVKNQVLRVGDRVEPQGRLSGEGRVIADAAAIVASTVQERRDLVDLYAAHPDRIHLIPPGVDHTIFTPGDKADARRTLGFLAERLLLFVGRLQPLKAADTAIRALAHLVEWGRVDLGATQLLVVGGASGQSGQSEPIRLQSLAERLGIASAVTFVPAQPQSHLRTFYRAADVCLVPSHAESFGLVALEAQACGTPVVGSAVGGLRSIVRHGQTGFLVDPHSAEAFAERAWQVLSDPKLAASIGRLAVCSSAKFSWDAAAEQLHELYASSRKREEMFVGRE